MSDLSTHVENCRIKSTCWPPSRCRYATVCDGPLSGPFGVWPNLASSCSASICSSLPKYSSTSSLYFLCCCSSATLSARLHWLGRRRSGPTSEAFVARYALSSVGSMICAISLSEVDMGGAAPAAASSVYGLITAGARPLLCAVCSACACSCCCACSTNDSSSCLLSLDNIVRRSVRNLISATVAFSRSGPSSRGGRMGTLNDVRSSVANDGYRLMTSTGSALISWNSTIAFSKFFFANEWYAYCRRTLRSLSSRCLIGMSVTWSSSAMASSNSLLVTSSSTCVASETGTSRQMYDAAAM
eukprot:Unigene117_Nuclearia_a/m.387 Unigene117_Nuclearia_a/g.387  ORF Unigene117_Nuclearia_a/g.387 Unigene117_Nuclearia_a/m.387 type:complete len:300 (+) Unigene117_Nuclearia_a:954-1853(+)